MIENRKIIALCIARIQDDVSNEYITALNKVVSPKGYSIFVYNTCSEITDAESKDASHTFVYELMDYEVIDAVIVFEDVIRNQKITDELIRRTKKHGVPVIVLGESQEGCINIQFDHENEFVEIVRHMIQVHHLTKLHFMAGTKGNSFSECRLETFRRVLQEHNLPFDESMVSYGDFWSIPAEQATEKLIASGNLPEAIICANDRMAMAVCAVLSRHGIKIPEEVAVTGFDGISEIAVTSPRITSVICSTEDLAEKTLEVLLKMDNLVGETATFFVPPRLCIAESCGCNGEKTRNAAEHLNTVYDRLYRFQQDELELSKITTRVQRCDTIEQAAIQMKDEILYDMCCIVEKECVDETINPAISVEKEYARDREMIVLYDSDCLDTFVPYQMPLTAITPHLDYMLEHDRVLVFTALHHADIPMGYICFFFSELSTSNYMKVPQTINALNNAIGGFRNLRHEHYLSNRIDAMYKVDTLTGLYNRRGFEAEYQKLLQSTKGNLSLSIVMADLDGLKYINDTFGHKEGDFAIHAVAQALLKICPEGAVCTRFGGDEMLAVCCGVQNPESLKNEFEKYFKEFNAQSGKEYAVNASVGVYITGENEILDFEELVEKSDRLMYEEKKRRKKSCK